MWNINYYICFILCGAVTLSYHVSLVKRDYKPVYAKKETAEEETPDDEAYRLVQEAHERLPGRIDVLQANDKRNDPIPLPAKVSGEDNSKIIELQADDPAGKTDDKGNIS